MREILLLVFCDALHIILYGVLLQRVVSCCFLWITLKWNEMLASKGETNEQATKIENHIQSGFEIMKGGGRKI